jgi:ribosome biogenesis GTPase A
LKLIKLEWYNDIVAYCRFSPEVVLLGNKSDIQPSQVDSKSAREFAEKHKISFYETSAKAGDNIETGFTTLARQMVHTKKQQEHPTELDGIKLQDTEYEKTNICCN